MNLTEMTANFKVDSLTVKQYTSRKAMGKAAATDVAELIIKLLSEKDEINMIFAAAPSQNEFLNGIISDDRIDFSRINAFHMDEYIGLDKEAVQGFGNFLKSALFNKAEFKSVSYINGQANDTLAECNRYTELLKHTRIDIVCMGIGENGHIAFNDPHVALFEDPAYVKIVELDLKCRQQQVNDGCFSSLDDVPKNAITLTIPALMNADYIFCIVPALTKAKAVRDTLKGDISEQCPATVLRTCKNTKAVMYIDADSGSML